VKADPCAGQNRDANFCTSHTNYVDGDCKTWTSTIGWKDWCKCNLICPAGKVPNADCSACIYSDPCSAWHYDASGNANDVCTGDWTVPFNCDIQAPLPGVNQAAGCVLKDPCYGLDDSICPASDPGSDVSAGFAYFLAKSKCTLYNGTNGAEVCVKQCNPCPSEDMNQDANTCACTTP
jgi:hypothetical protein